MAAMASRRNEVGESVRLARLSFDSWERSCEDRMAELRHIAQSPQAHEEYETLKKQLDTLCQQKSLKKSELTSRQQQQEFLKEKVEQAEERSGYLIKRLDLLKERRKTHSDAASDSLKDIEERLSLKQQKINAQNEAIKWYNNVLGIRAEFSSAIKFIFTKINPKSPQQEFSCTIRLDKHTNKYAILDCVPYVKKSTDLVDDLNITNEFFEFMRLMRHEFEMFVEESVSRQNSVAEWCSSQLQATMGS